MTVQLPDPSGDLRTCEFCDAHVTSDFRRSYGTGNRRALRCPNCDSWARIERGSAAGRDVDHPDPQNHANRNGGRELRGPTAVEEVLK